MFKSVFHQFGRAAKTEFLENIVFMGLHRPGANIQFFCYLFDIQSISTQLHNLQFSVCESILLLRLGCGDGMDDLGNVLPEILQSVMHGVDGLFQGRAVGVFADKPADAEFRKELDSLVGD